MKKTNLTLILLLSSCTVGKNYKNPEIFKSDEIQKSIGLNNTKINNETVLFSPYNFNDEILNLFMDEVQEKSPNIKIAISKLKQARNNLKITSKNGFPMFDFTLSRNYENGSKIMNNVLDEDYYQTGLDMSWELDIFGKNRRKSEALNAVFMGEIYNLKNINISLVSEVATTYINLRNIEENLKNANSNLKLQQEAYDIIYKQYSLGLVDDIILSQAKYLVETTKMQIPDFEYEYEAYLNSLAILLGRLPGQISEITINNNENIINKDFSYNLDDLYNLPVDIIRNRPDVKIIEENLIAQNAIVGEAIASLYPSFSISAFLGFEVEKFNKIINKDSRAYSVIPEFSLPLFNWGRLRNNIKLQKLIKEEALAQYELTLLKAISEVKNAITAVKKEYEKNIAAKLAYENMDKAASLYWKNYLLGLTTYNNVLTAEQRRLNTQRDMVNSNAKLYNNMVRFYKAIGGKPMQIKPEENK